MHSQVRDVRHETEVEHIQYPEQDVTLGYLPTAVCY